MQKYTITISGLTDSESASIKKLECDNCKVSSSFGFLGTSKEILNIVGEDPIIQSVVADIIAAILIRIGEDSWNRCKVNFKFPNGRTLSNIARSTFEELKKLFNSEDE